MTTQNIQTTDEVVKGVRKAKNIVFNKSFKMLEQDQQLCKQKPKITAKYFKQNKQISIQKAIIFFKPSDEVR